MIKSEANRVPIIAIRESRSPLSCSESSVFTPQSLNNRPRHHTQTWIGCLRTWIGSIERGNGRYVL